MTTDAAKSPRAKARILVVDDDDAIREVLRDTLSDTYEVIDTGNAEQGLELALQQRPDCILLDLLMPRYSGLELCQTLKSMSFTQMIPIFIITGHSNADHRAYCLNLGVKDFFEKPLDFPRLKASIAQVVMQTVADRRVEPRLRIRARLVLRGYDKLGAPFEVTATTDNLSVSGFSCAADITLELGASVDVALFSDSERLVARAKVVRSELHPQGPTVYGFKITEKHGPWVLG
jgi:response regulator RpfG family c-di-GMP phosphodiesterase